MQHLASPKFPRLNMGTGGSVEEKVRHNSIEQKIQAERKNINRTVKLLLLGAGESGKSTVLKQIRIIHDNGFSEAELEALKNHVYKSIIENTAQLILAMERMEITFQNPKLEKFAISIIEHDGAICGEMGEMLKELWKDPGIKAVYDRRNEFQLVDSIKYFLENIERISDKSYVPNSQDVLFLRLPSKGVVETRIPYKQFFINVVDVAGQRSERRKWLKCFDNVEGVMFVIAVNEYDQVLAEDPNTNRLHESLRVFSSICNSDFFLHSSLLVFLNKKDLLVEKIQRKIPFNPCFPQFKGALNYESVIGCIRERVVELHANPKKELYMHETCATDTGQLKFVLNTCLDIVMQTNLKRVGVS